MLVALTTWVLGLRRLVAPSTNAMCYLMRLDNACLDLSMGMSKPDGFASHTGCSGLRRSTSLVTVSKVKAVLREQC